MSDLDVRAQLMAEARDTVRVFYSKKSKADILKALEETEFYRLHALHERNKQLRKLNDLRAVLER